MFRQAKWIWCRGGQSQDLYVNFIKEFESGEKATLKIASDSNYTVYINGELAAFGQYANYPTYKVYDSVDISRFVKPGKNTFAAIVWYFGAPCFTYYPGDAGLIYEIESDGKIAAKSDEENTHNTRRKKVFFMGWYS